MTSLFRPRQYHRPTSLEEAVSLLAELGEKAIPIAGGTDLLVEKPSGIEYLIDLTRLPLVYIETIPETLDIRIGALTTVREIETARLFKEENYRIHNILSETARQLGYMTIRNLATIGGNICNAVPSADFPPVLIALDSRAKIIGPSGERNALLEEFFVDVRRTILRSNELLIEIQVPGQPPRTGLAFQKLGRVHTDIALVNVACRLTFGSDGTCKDTRIVLGAVAPTPIRAKRAEEMLIGKNLNDSLIQKIAQAASSETEPISDIRASAEYRRNMCRVLTARALRQALERAEGGE
jgi:carbon-monoxide dehydrogenase medium subunit